MAFDLPGCHHCEHDPRREDLDPTLAPNRHLIREWRGGFFTIRFNSDDGGAHG
jgi:hypothetical protein